MNIFQKFFTFLFCLTINNQCPDKDFIVQSFKTYLNIHKNNIIDVYETISCDFGITGKHGIYRFIPLTYKFNNSNKIQNIQIRLISVTNNNEIIAYDLNPCEHNNFLIKIGKPTIRGKYTVAKNYLYHKNTFRIHYQVLGAIRWENKQPIIAWNTTGNQWSVSLNNVSAILHVPSGINHKLIKLSSSTYNNRERKYPPAKSSQSDIIFTTPIILPGQEFIVKAILPQNSLAYNSNMVLKMTWFFDYWISAIVLILLTLSITLIQWFVLGRDKAKLKSIAVDFSPPKNLTPAEVGIIYDESFDGSDLSATILDLACRGYLTIKQIPSNSIYLNNNFDLLFTKTDLKFDNDNLKPFEKILLNNIFRDNSKTENLSAMVARTNQTYLKDIKDFLYEELTTKNYFPTNPENIRNLYYKLAAFSFVVGISFLLYLYVYNPNYYLSVPVLQNLPIIIGFSLSSIILAYMAPFMPRRSIKGVEALREILGFKRFIEKAQLKQIKAFALENPASFGRILPYAVALSLEKDWSKILNALNIDKPDWYEINSNLNKTEYTNYNFMRDLCVLNIISNQMLTTAFNPSNYNNLFNSNNSIPELSTGSFDSGSFDSGSFGGGGGDAW